VVRRQIVKHVVGLPFDLSHAGEVLFKVAVAL
jgi:hypothetical protein